MSPHTGGFWSPLASVVKQFFPHHFPVNAEIAPNEWSVMNVVLIHQEISCSLDNCFKQATWQQNILTSLLTELRLQFEKSHLAIYHLQ